MILRFFDTAKKSCTNAVRAIPLVNKQNPKRHHYGIYAITNRACETAGVRMISHHDMRHSCATNLVASGEYTLVDAARFLGHKNAFVTANTYAHSPQTHKAAIADSVSKRMRRMVA